MQGIIYKNDKEYPNLLKQIGKDAPKQLYFKVSDSNTCFQQKQETKIGRVSKAASLCSENGRDTAYELSIFDNSLAVVGSRKLTHYGKQAIEKIVGQIALNNITIVSGFMYGGDATAHETAIKAGGRTIAVMPCGINRISPEDQEELYNDIIENNGMIISEYEGDMPPALWTYPRRNRIVAGLSKALLVIEAGEKSGSLITANLAKKFKRKIFALPGPVTSNVSTGTNLLIKEGAEIVTSADDILSYFNKAQKTKFFKSLSPIPPAAAGEQRAHACDSKNLSFFSPCVNLENKIIEILKREPLGVDEISREFKIPIPELSVKLSVMEMQGLIQLKGNKYYTKT